MCKPITLGKCKAKLMKRKQIRFVYFDLGRVIIDVDAAVRKLAQYAKKTPKEVKRFFDSHWMEACRGTIHPTEYARMLKRHLDLHHKARSIGELWTDFFEPVPDVHDFVRRISQQMPVGVISNIEHGVFEKALQKGQIPNIHWTTVIESCRFGVIKPEPEIFRIAQRLAKVTHEEIFLIDDREENVEAARALGWDGVVFDKKRIDQSLQKIRNLLSSPVPPR